MVESSPLEAAAMRRQVKAFIDAYRDASPRMSRFLALHGVICGLRAAIAAYEAEQTTPDLGELAWNADPLRDILREFAEVIIDTGFASTVEIDRAAGAIVAHLKGETR